MAGRTPATSPWRVNALLLLGHGGPRSPADVPAFLRSVRGGREPSPAQVAEVVRRYEAIGGSPLAPTTSAAASALAERLDVPVEVGWLYSRPSIDEAVDAVAAHQPARVLAVCLSAFASGPGSGACLSALQRAAEQQGAAFTLDSVERIGDRQEYLGGTAAAVRATLAAARSEGLGNPLVLFTTHSLPRTATSGAVEYEEQFSRAAAAIASLAGLGATDWRTAYQSAPHGAQGWLGPDVHQVVSEIAAAGGRCVVVASIGFLADQLEVLYDIDVELRAASAELGVAVRRVPLLNDGPAFLDAVAGIASDSWPAATPGPSRNGGS